MLPNTALAVFLPSRGAVIHKHIFSYNSSADDPVIADLVWRQFRSDRGAGAALVVLGSPWCCGHSGVSPPSHPNAQYYSLLLWVLLGILVG